MMTPRSESNLSHVTSVRATGSRVVLLVSLTVAFGLVAAGCGSGKTTTTTNAQGQTTVSCSIHFAKTKFVVHAGIAAGAFYRYIYNPYRAGTFKKNAPGRKRALVKAAATSLVVVHELKLASRDAQCDGPALKKVAKPIRALLDAVSSLKAIETGSGLGAIATAATAFDKLKAASAGAGAVIKQK
jgi:hypothetical protein